MFRTRFWDWTSSNSRAAKIFISPEGHSVRYLVQTKLDPFSTEAMDQVNTIGDAARRAQPNTRFADASISMGGFPPRSATPVTITSRISGSSTS